MAQDVCSEKGWTLVDLPPDEAMSGYKGINKIKGSLGSFLKRVKQGEVSKGSVLIIEKMDRFSRNEVDLVIPDFLLLLQSGIEIYSCVDRTHYTLADIRGRNLLQYAVMAMAMANEYSKSLGERVSRSVDIRIQQAKAGTAINFGPWIPRWIDFKETNGKGTFAFNRHADTIKRICNDYINGKSMYGIAQELVKENVPTLKNGKWSQGTIGALLGNHCLIGDVEISGTYLKGYFPPVIAKGDYDKLQAKLRENKQRKGGSKTSHVANLFRNRIICHHCGRVMESRKVMSHGGYLFTCRSRRVKQCSCRKSVSVAAIEMDFFLHYMQQTPGEIMRANTPEQADKVTEIQAEIAGYDKEISKAMELLSTLPLDELKSKLATLEQKRQAAKARLDTVNATMRTASHIPQAIQTLKELLKDMGANKADNQSKAEQRVAMHLRSHSTRQRMLGLLPSIIKGLVIDTTNQRYAVLSHSGNQSDWRKI